MSQNIPLVNPFVEFSNFIGGELFNIKSLHIIVPASFHQRRFPVWTFNVIKYSLEGTESLDMVLTTLAEHIVNKLYEYKGTNPEFLRYSRWYITPFLSFYQAL